MPNPNDIALNLARMRVKHDLSQEGLANTLGLSRQAVSKWERGESVPDLGNLMALSDLYGVTIDELVRGPENAENRHALDTNAESTMAESEMSGETSDDSSASLGSRPDTSELDEFSNPNETVESTDTSAAESPLAFQRTWSRKTILITALGCLLVLALVCGFIFVMLRDEGSPTSVAGKSAQEIAQEVAQESEKTEYNGRLIVVAEERFDSQDVNSFHIDWYNGQASLCISDDPAAKDMILVRESSTMPLNDDERMQCGIKDGTLKVTSVNAGLLLDVPQHVDIIVPTDLAKDFTDVSLTGLASSYSIEGITCMDLQVNIPSDSSTVRTTNVQAENLGLNKNGRSNAMLEGSFKYIQVGQTSGAIKIIDAIQPEALHAIVHNGDLSITLPKDSAFALGADVSSGLVTCEFAQYESVNVYSGFTEKDVEAICCGRPGTTTPLYEFTARTSHITLTPGE